MSKENSEVADTEALLAINAELERRIAELEAQQADAAIESKLSELRANYETQLADLAGQLDEAKAAQKAAEDALAAHIAADEQAKADAEAAAAFLALKAERVAKVEELALFDADHVAASAERWASMSDEEFASNLADWAQIASRKVDAGVPVATVLAASREMASAGSQSTGSHADLIRNVRSGRNAARV